jgi:predicted MFS family arabinose efflux permease
MGPLISGFLEVRLGWSGFFYFLAVTAALAAALFWAWCRDMGSDKPGRHSLIEIFPLIGQAFRSPGLLYLSFGAFCLFLAYIGVLTFTADYLKTFVRLPSDEVGLLLSLTGFSGIPVSPVAGYLGDRFSRPAVFFGGMVLVLAALGLMAVWDYDRLRYAALFLLLGTGSAAAWTSLNTLAVQSSSTLRNAVTSLYNVIKFSGYAFAPVILAIFYGNGSLRAIQVACMVAAVLSILLVFRAKPTQP